MTRICTYLKFAGQAEEAFAFYKSIFGTEFDGVITRFGNAPPMEGRPELSESDKQLVMNVQMPIADGHLLLGSDVLDAPDAMEDGQRLNVGNNSYICIQADTRDETDTLFAALAEGGNVEMALADMFWGDYFGSFADKFGIQWMVAAAATRSARRSVRARVRQPNAPLVVAPGAGDPDALIATETATATATTSAPVADARSVPKSRSLRLGRRFRAGFRNVLRRASLLPGDVVIGALFCCRNQAEPSREASREAAARSPAHRPKPKSLPAIVRTWIPSTIPPSHHSAMPGSTTMAFLHVLPLIS